MQVTAFVILVVADAGGSSMYFMAWAWTSMVGVLVGWRRLDLHRPRLGGAHEWFREHSTIVRSLGLEYLLVTGVAQGAPLVAGAVAGMTAVGGIRATLTAYGPITAANHGLSMSIRPESARRWARGDPRFYIPLVGIAVVLAITCLLWIALVLLLPRSIGELLLGASWESARDLAVVTGVWLGVGYLAVPAFESLRIIGKDWLATRIRMVLAPLSLVGTAIGAALGGAQGAMAGLVVTGLVNLVVYWLFFFSARRTWTAADEHDLVEPTRGGVRP
jgi:O-antigen/teichoic acid export membrane protein